MRSYTYRHTWWPDFGSSDLCKYLGLPSSFSICVSHHQASARSSTSTRMPSTRPSSSGTIRICAANRRSRSGLDHRKVLAQDESADRQAGRCSVLRALFHERLEYGVGTILVELDAHFRPKVVGEVIQLPTCGDRHDECLCLFVDREFGNAHCIRNHLN
jgi:hypothetical protein